MKIFNDILYWLHIGGQWQDCPSYGLIDPDKPEVSYHSLYHHYRK